MSRVRVWFCEWPGELAHAVDEYGMSMCGRTTVPTDQPNALTRARRRCFLCEQRMLELARRVKLSP